MPSNRRLAAIMFTDIVGYTALMGRDEALAFKVLDQNRGIQRPLIKKHNGEWLKEMGDGVLAAFSSSTDALRCAKEIIVTAKSMDINLRIGIHLGEVVFQNDDVFGDGVNIAARVESLGVPGSVLMTEKVYDDIRNKPDVKAVYLGEFSLKNVSKSVEIYALDAEGLQVPDKSAMAGKSELPKWMPTGSTRIKSLLIGLAILLFAGYLAKEYLGSNTTEYNNQGSAESGISEIVSLACLPFSNISQNEEIDFLGFALADQVISSLSYLKNVAVRPSGSVRKYSNGSIDPLLVGNELGVQFVLMGHYMKNGDAIRLNLELIDVQENSVLWRGSVQEEMADVFHLQDLVAQNVIDGLEVQFSIEERSRMIKDAPGDPLAYEYYLKGLNYSHNVEGNLMAIDLLRKSIDLDSTFAPAHCELGYRVYMVALYTVINDRSAKLDMALKNLQHALELNNELLNALGNLALLYTDRNQKEEALVAAKRMIAINPNSALGHFALGYIYRYTGMIDAAITEMEIAVNIDPKTAQFRSIGITYNLTGRYEDAIKALHYDDGSGFNDMWLGWSYIRLNKFDLARPMLRRARQQDSMSTLGILAGLLLASIDGSPPDMWIEQVRQICPTLEDPESIYLWGVACIMIRDREYGLTLIRKAVDFGYYPYSTLQIDPLLDSVRDEPEFQLILEAAKVKHEAFKAKHF